MAQGLGESVRTRTTTIFRALLGLMLFGWLAAGEAAAELPPPLPSADAAALRSAFQLESAGRWADAVAMTGRMRDPLARKLVLWRAFAEAPNPGDFSDLAAFIDANPNWPARKALLSQAEKALYQERTYRDVGGWLRRHPPASGVGRVLEAETLMARGRTQDGIALLRKSWAEDDYPGAIEADILARFTAFLRPADHAARADRLLWGRDIAGAARLAPYLDPEHRILVKVRTDLIRLAPQAGQEVGTVPSRLRRNPGLLYEQVRWRRQTGAAESAAALLQSVDGSAIAPLHADAWWNERGALIRAMLKQREFRAAYRLASSHRQTSGTDFAEAEWLAGWLSLRFLNDPNAAYAHFANMYKGVGKPISLARGAYWAGRAAEASGRTADARNWYDEASRYLTTFYGQLAAETLGRPAAAPLPRAPVPTAAQRRDFASREVVRAARLMADAGQDRYVRMFAGRLAADTQSPADWVLLGQFFAQLGRTDLEVWIGKQAGYQHIVLPNIAYPRMALPASVTIDRALVHGLSRQESAFYTRAVSSAGARGLMQLMPGTAEMMARQIGVPYSLPRLTADPQYNVTLGTTYLQRMVDRFDGAYVLAIAAYNAGPGRVDQWLGTFGDPRTGQIDMLDWIELIPLGETRNYVQRVLENTQVYRQLLGGVSVPLRIHDDIYRGASAERADGTRRGAPS